MSDLVIIRISNDTSMMSPWGVGDVAVAMGFPASNTAVVIKCTHVELVTDGEKSSVAYTMRLLDDDAPGWGQFKGGDEQT